MSKKSKFQIEYTKTFMLVLFMFLLSVGFIVLGLTKRESGNSVESGLTKKVILEENSFEEGSLQDYFKTSETPTYEADDEYIKTDPFAELCAPVSGDGIPSIHSNTVCMR